MDNGKKNYHKKLGCYIQKRGKILKCIYICRGSKQNGFVLKWADTLRLNAFGSLIDFMSLERALKPFEPLKVKEH